MTMHLVVHLSVRRMCMRTKVDLTTQAQTETFVHSWVRTHTRPVRNHLVLRARHGRRSFAASS